MIRPEAAADPYFAGSPTAPKGWVAAELVPGERVVWSGRPRPHPASFATTLGRLAPLGGVAGGLLLLLVAARGHGLATLQLSGIAAIVAGAVAAWEGLRSARERAGTSYALTDRRAIIRTPRAALPGGAEVRSFEPWALGTLARCEHVDGSGDLVFEEIRVVGVWNTIEVTRRGFLGVDDVRSVEGLVRATLLDGPAAG